MVLGPVVNFDGMGWISFARSRMERMGLAGHIDHLWRDL